MDTKTPAIVIVSKEGRKHTFDAELLKKYSSRVKDGNQSEYITDRPSQDFDLIADYINHHNINESASPKKTINIGQTETQIRTEVGEWDYNLIQKAKTSDPDLMSILWTLDWLMLDGMFKKISYIVAWDIMVKTKLDPDAVSKEFAAQLAKVDKK